MLDLRSMADEEFTIFVTPSLHQATTHITVEESGKVLLCGKIAEKFSKIPVHIQFNQDYSAVQISPAAVKAEDSVIFHGRKGGLNAAEMLRRNNIQLPAVFRGYFCGESNKWRGERQQNPTSKLSPTIQRTKKN